MTVQQDRASTNGKVLRLIRRDKPAAQPTCNDCSSHTSLSNAGKAILQGEKAKYINEFRKIWQQIIQYYGGARTRAKEKTGETIKEAGSVRFFVRYEQISQISEYGLQKVITEIVKYCKENKYSETSSTNTMLVFGGGENKGKLAMAILEGIALKYAALRFCTCCYSLEGDAPLILTAYDVLDGLETKILNGFDMPTITATAELVAKMLEELAAPLLEAKQQAGDVLRYTEQQLQNAISSVIPLTTARGRLTHSINTAGRERQRTAHATDHDAVAIVDAQLIAANEAVEEGNRVKDLPVKALKKEDKLLQEWKHKFPARTVAELIQYTHDGASPGIAYYRKQYREKGGDLYRLRLSAEACQIFDPFKLCSFSVERLNLLADKLSHFEYRQFTSEFIKGLKKEIPLAIVHSQ